MKDKYDYLKLLSPSYPTVRSVITELINLNAILNLPKGTEHFMSDLHGEYEAFQHIMNNCSGVIREKIDLVFGDTLSKEQRSQLCTLIYYPSEKMEQIKLQDKDTTAWYIETLNLLIDLCKVLSSKYTRSKVRKALPKEYSYIIDELLHANSDEDINQQQYHKNIFNAIVNTESADDFIIEISKLIKVLAVDKLHVLGDIFDRGPNPDKIMDALINHHNADIQWGNHDILWMGAVAGNDACIACAVRNNISSGNYEFLENGYGISMRPLALFAEKTYGTFEKEDDAILNAISIIQFKLETQIIKRNPDYHMNDRLLLDMINYDDYSITIDSKKYILNKDLFVTVNPNKPQELTKEEQAVINQLHNAFVNSSRLKYHTDFLYEKGSIYKICNDNLLYHGCIPLNEDGSLMEVTINNKVLWGKHLLDEFEQIARNVYYQKEPSQYELDCMWFLWCGKTSPLYGRSKMSTFERLYIQDKNTHIEEKNPYYTLCDDEKVCDEILKDFELNSKYSHIINGHVPVKVISGESPVKGNGKLFFIDGGFCSAYQKTTGIAGYTLIFNSHGMRILSHRPFQGIDCAINNNDDIISKSDLIETSENRIMVENTDDGKDIKNKINMLTELLKAYRTNKITPKSK